MHAVLLFPVQHTSPLLLIKASGADGRTSVPALSEGKETILPDLLMYPISSGHSDWLRYEQVMQMTLVR